MKKVLFVVMQFFWVFSLYSRPLVLLSSKISPYMETYEGIKKIYNGKVELRFVEDEPKDIYIYSPWFVVGDEAFDYAVKFSDGRKIIFSLVESRELKVLNKKNFVGYKLEYPPKIVARKIKNILGDRNIRIGIPFDPRNNFIYESKLSDNLKDKPVIKNIAVTSDGELVTKLQNLWGELDFLLLIPDFTVINEGNINYIFSNALKNGVGVIGYNKWFLKRGAVFSYFIDYFNLGKDMVKLYKEGKSGFFYYKNIKTIGNGKIINKLGLEFILNKVDYLWK